MSDNPGNMRGTRDNNRANDIPANNGKGDSKANTTNPTQPDQTQYSQATDSNPNTSPHPSLAQRIQSSATGLARSAFVDPNAAQVLSSATNGKTGSSTSSSLSSTVSREAYGPSNNSLSSGGVGQPARGTSEAFRESDVQEQAGGFSIPALSEEEFQRGENAFEDTNWSTPRSSEGSLQNSNGNWKGKQRAQDPVQGEYTTAWDRANTNAQTPATENYTETQTDGAAVVSLLSSSSFDAGFTNENEFDPDAAPPPLTAEEIKLLDSFRREIPREDPGIASSQTQTQSQPAHLSSLSLVPDIDTFLQQNDPSAYSSQNSRDETGKSLSLRDDVLAHLPGAEDWVGVHERYHDEVWGYLRPALEAAKVEIEEEGQVEGTGHDGDGPAVRRLKMILEHMKV
ncbi:hypothetical protein N7456_008472 [Penicillium angulare]|uniref:Uncharacterized protein n=1 Tax=Penicillium angulare TaxID=116970 RepID=A0A9W9FCT4_9EURO|nr:hypothetical protein N7456_008472 [Penicillium angulare]